VPPCSIAFAIYFPALRQRVDPMRQSINRCVFSVVLALMSAGAALSQDKRALASRGEGLLTGGCSKCHAVGRTGNSTQPDAPPFRTLGQRYPIEALAEALAEGLSSSHEDMPEFRFDIDDIDAILAYLGSIQEKAPAGAGTPAGTGAPAGTK
jgi:cytochrome c